MEGVEVVCGRHEDAPAGRTGAEGIVAGRDWTQPRAGRQLLGREGEPAPVIERDRRWRDTFPERAGRLDAFDKPVPVIDHDRIASIGQKRAAPTGQRDHPPVAVAGLRSEEHTSELQSLMRISYAVFCLKKKKKHRDSQNYDTRIANNTKHT